MVVSLCTCFILLRIKCPRRRKGRRPGVRELSIGRGHVQVRGERGRSCCRLPGVGGQSGGRLRAVKVSLTVLFTGCKTLEEMRLTFAVPVVKTVGTFREDCSSCGEREKNKQTKNDPKTLIINRTRLLRWLRWTNRWK